MGTAALIVLGFVAWTALLVLLYRLGSGVRGVLEGVEDLAESVRSPDLARLEAELGGVKAQVEKLPSIWEDHEKRAKRAAERERFYARQAAERTEGFDGGGAESVLDDDGGSRANGGVQPMPQTVAPPQPITDDYIAAGWRRKLMG